MFAPASTNHQAARVGAANNSFLLVNNHRIRTSASVSKILSTEEAKWRNNLLLIRRRRRMISSSRSISNNNSSDKCTIYKRPRRQRIVLVSSSLANEQPSDTKNAFYKSFEGKEWSTNLRATCEAIVKVNEAEDIKPELSLASYMRLPVEQYVDVPLPLGAKMTKYFDETIEEDEGFFELTIPGLKFFTLEVKPVVRVKVSVLRTEEEQRLVWSGKPKRNDVKAEEEEKRRKKMNKMYRPEREDADMRGPCVLIEVASCRLEGKEVESLGINEMFVNRGSTAFRWKSRGDESWDRGDLLHYGIGSAEHADVNDASSKKEEQEKKYAYIEGWTEIGVGVDPPGPFKKFPRSLTQNVGDAVLGFTLREIEKTFLRGLARDYERWCSDTDYRRQRATAFEDVGAWTEKDEVI
tara:strand:- start:728 stop:1954 length:1227 start_codon:yes stop_codon:yes gene_type:complete